VKIRSFSDKDITDWDNFLSSSEGGTFLHSRRFLSYHNNRYNDCSLIIEDKSNIIGLFPAAVSPHDTTCVVSHPGATYGGVILTARKAPATTRELFDAILSYYAAHGFKSLIYKSIPTHIQACPSQIDIYELLSRGARITRRDLWNVINLSSSRQISKGRKWGINKAKKNGVIVRQNDADGTYEQFYMILTEVLESKYAVKPVHSLRELLILKDQFPGNISLWTATDSDNTLLAGVWLFCHGKTAWHTQYIGTSILGRKYYALDLLIETMIQCAIENNIAFFSFGASTDNEGKSINKGLFDYKSEFGAGTIVHDFYSLSLESGKL
jgi:hypothetical protein